jgi:hypothetical protein
MILRFSPSQVFVAMRMGHVAQYLLTECSTNINHRVLHPDRAPPYSVLSLIYMR